MATSGTFAFGPSNADLALSAFARIGLRRTALAAEHMRDAYLETNYLLSSWSNLQPNLWNVDLVSQTLTSGVATYAVDAKTVMILDAYIEYGTPAVDRLISAISRTEYAAYPDKTVQGNPTVFWFDRLTSPTVTVWPVPDSSTTYTLKYYRVTQNQDANLTNGETPAVPYRWIDAWVAGLAHRLARIYAPALEQQRAADAKDAWAIAATQDVENTPLMIAVGTSQYWY